MARLLVVDPRPAVREIRRRLNWRFISFSMPGVATRFATYENFREWCIQEGM